MIIIRSVRYFLHFSLLLVLVVCGCANLPTDYPRTQSTALADWSDTTLGHQFDALAAAHPGESGFVLIRRGRDAFNNRVALTQLARRTLDVQVYIWQPDETGYRLAQSLLEAADRGVRVRLLIDDMGFGGTDRGIGSIDAHPNIEARLYNPFLHRQHHMLDFAYDMDRVNHRMHNKMMIADNSAAIVGGRNIGDHYFSVDPETNFRDIDIGAVGPVVRDISQVFDYFWRNDTAVPVAALFDTTYTDADLQRFREVVAAHIGKQLYPYDLSTDVQKQRDVIARVAEELTWAHGTIVWNSPERTMDDEKGAEMNEALYRKLATLKHSIELESAYFIPGEGGVETIRGLVARGVKVQILTNSLASNDVIAAFAGYSRYRKPLLEAGAELYELRADSGVVKKTWKGESRAGLHAKAFVFDDESIFVGSFNLDPRSSQINTEGGLYVESPELARQLLDYMDEGILPENSYRLYLNADGELRWEAQVNGVNTIYDQDPLTSFGQRFTAGLIRLLPVESQL